MMNLTLKKFLSSLSAKNLFVYLLLGLFILLHLFLVFKTFIHDSESIRVAYAGFGDMLFHMTQVSNFGFTGLFNFAQTVKTQPWDFDTNKIFAYFAFFASGAIIYFLLEIRNKLKTFGTFIFIVSFALIIFSGVIDILPRTFAPIKTLSVSYI